MARRTAGGTSKAASSKKTGSRKSGGKTTATAKKTTAAKRGQAGRAGQAGKKKTAKGRKTAAAAKKSAAPKKAPAATRGQAGRAGKTGKKKAATRAAGAGTRRRELELAVPSPPSSLNLNRRGSSVRSGRADVAQTRAEDAHFTPAIAGGDSDVNVEDAYFTGDEAPGGDNPTPDQEVVDEIGRALGVEYQDNEELRGADKVEDRDRHRWELDPASAEDYRDRD